MNKEQNITELFGVLFAPHTLEPQQLAVWLTKHHIEVVRQALAATGVRFLKLKREMSLDYITRYSSSIMNRMTADKETQHGTAAIAN